MSEWATTDKVFFLRALWVEWKKSQQTSRTRRKISKTNRIKESQSQSARTRTHIHLCNSQENDDEVVWWWWSTTQLLLQTGCCCVIGRRREESFFFVVFYRSWTFFSAVFISSIRVRVCLCPPLPIWIFVQP